MLSAALPPPPPSPPAFSHLSSSLSSLGLPVLSPPSLSSPFRSCSAALSGSPHTSSSPIPPSPPLSPEAPLPQPTLHDLGREAGSREPQTHSLPDWGGSEPAPKPSAAPQAWALTSSGPGKGREEGEQAERGWAAFGGCQVSSALLTPASQTFDLKQDNVIAMQMQVQGEHPSPLPHGQTMESPVFRWCPERLAARRARGARHRAPQSRGSSRMSILAVSGVLGSRQHRSIHTCVSPHACTCTHARARAHTHTPTPADEESFLP